MDARRPLPRIGLVPAPFSAPAIAGVLGLVLALALAGCGASATPSPAAPEVSLTPPPGGTQDDGLTVRALNIDFEPKQLNAPAGKALVITLDNKDAGVPHDLAIQANGATIAKTDIITGLARAELQVGPLEAGTYTFACEIHPNMTGTLTVGP